MFYKTLAGQIRGIEKKMRNCNEVLKRAIVPSVSEGMRPEKLLLEKGKQAENTEDWFRDDFKSIILRNMGIEEDGIQDRE